MASFLLLIVCLLLGLLTARLDRHPKDLHKHLNWWVLHIALPAMVLELIPKLQFDTSLWFLFVSMWLMFIGAWGVFHAMGLRLNWSRRIIGTTVLMAGMSNTAFVGLPLIEALRGKAALPYAAIADQLGCFMAITIGGSLVIATYSGDRLDARNVARRVIVFPPFIALLFALLFAALGGTPAIFDNVLARVSGTLTPLALFSVGLQLKPQLDTHRLAPFVLGLGWKLAVAPLLILGLGRLLQINAGIADITVLQAGMAPMIAAAIMAEQHDLDSPLANAMVGIGILLSFITVPLWNFALQ